MPALLFAQGWKSKTLITLGDRNISAGEFMEVYEKNNIKSEVVDKKSVDEYLDMYINFKLKVIEAENLKMDTLPKFVKEYEGYREQLSKPYFSSEAATEDLIKEAYERMKYDIIIVGGGPAGLTAAIYARRANKSVLVIEKATFGGQITFSPKVENIPGFTALSGNEFAEKLVDQALAQGVDMESAEVLSVTGNGPFTVVTDGDTFEARALIVATGAKHRMLGLAGEE